MLVTGGRGWYQEEGESARELHPGDVVKILPHVKHWHGAAKDSWFVHLAVEADASKGGANWMEPVRNLTNNSQCVKVDLLPVMKMNWGHHNFIVKSHFLIIEK